MVIPGRVVRAMGTLTAYLQAEFARCCPSGWSSRSEVGLLAPDLRELFGYSPRADVLLEQGTGARRIWIEFEVSRADPVANHAKFATAHLFQPQPATDTFVSMVSTHVARGRRNLAANTVSLMRHVGMRAFQTVLFPHLSAGEIARLNHMDLTAVPGSDRPAAEPEIERVLAITEPVVSLPSHRIHLVGDVLDALLNVRAWNAAMETKSGAAAWGRRTITYFVYDPHSTQFAPAKFCAFLPLANDSGQSEQPVRSPGRVSRAVMTVELYATLDGSDTRFDGHRAQSHLTRHLAMTPAAVANGPPGFRTWADRHQAHIQLHPAGAQILLPPPWFR